MPSSCSTASARKKAHSGDDGDAGTTRRVGVGMWVGFSAMTLGMFMAVLDIQIVVTSLPEISEALVIAPDKNELGANGLPYRSK